MAKVTAYCGEVFYLVLRGEAVPPSKSYPRCLQDDGLCRKFGEWCLENKIRVIRFITGGGGSEEACFDIKDQKKILKWFEENGVEINSDPSRGTHIYPEEK